MEATISVYDHFQQLLEWATVKCVHTHAAAETMQCSKIVS